MDDASRKYFQDLGEDPDRKGLPGTGWFGSNHIYYVFDEAGEMKVLNIPLQTPVVDASGKWTQPQMPDAPAGARAKNYRRDQGGAYEGGLYLTPEPRAAYNSDGTVKTAGWLPGNRWVDLDGTIFTKAASGDPLTALMGAAVDYAKTVVG
jgi:hypothetical protein